MKLSQIVERFWDFDANQPDAYYHGQALQYFAHEDSAALATAANSSQCEPKKTQTNLISGNVEPVADQITLYRSLRLPSKFQRLPEYLKG